MRFDFVNPKKITSVPKWDTCALQLKTEAKCIGRATTVQSLFPHVWRNASILRTEVNFFTLNIKIDTRFLLWDTEPGLSLIGH